MAAKPKKPRPLGRPPVPADARRTMAVRVLVSKDEHAELKQAADQAAMTVSTWVRALALERARRKD